MAPDTLAAARLAILDILDILADSEPGEDGHPSPEAIEQARAVLSHLEAPREKSAVPAVRKATSFFSTCERTEQGWCEPGEGESPATPELPSSAPGPPPSSLTPAPTLADLSAVALTLGIDSVACEGCADGAGTLANANRALAAVSAFRQAAPALADRLPPVSLTVHARRYVSGREGVTGTHTAGKVAIGTRWPDETPKPTLGEYGVGDSVGSFIRHELAHSAYSILTPAERQEWEGLFAPATFAEQVSKYGATDAEEGFSEALSAHLHPHYEGGLPPSVNAFLASLTGKQSAS